MPPADTPALLRDGGVESSMPAAPDGPPVVWDGKRKQASSAFFGKLEHGTSLLELPVCEVTKAEAYLAFHAGYSRAWSGFFDPVGIRFSLEPGKTKVEIFILPLVNSQEYAFLRSMTAGGLSRSDPAPSRLTRHSNSCCMATMVPRRVMASATGSCCT